ncbi:MAG: cyclic nucleotide-binding domain-containing protein [Chloracidobacterium sp.]|nr:cyclic nucleotide-binding domain-containing protein [Chloracidobacterium sp.]
MKPLLENISPELLEKLKSSGHKRSYGEDQEIFTRGDKADFLPIVLSGAVKMIRNPEVGKEVIIGIFRTGEMFAVPPVFDGAPYPSTAIAVEKTELLQISRNDFWIFYATRPSLRLRSSAGRARCSGKRRR